MSELLLDRTTTLRYDYVTLAGAVPFLGPCRDLERGEVLKKTANKRLFDQNYELMCLLIEL